MDQIRLLAESTAEELMADLHSGRLPKVGIREIRQALLRKVQGRNFTGGELDRLEELTTRLVCEKVG